MQCLRLGEAVDVVILFRCEDAALVHAVDVAEAHAGRDEDLQRSKYGHSKRGQGRRGSAQGASRPTYLTYLTYLTYSTCFTCTVYEEGRVSSSPLR
eukprot:scaffold59739_cov71-Phaeocystis_antarctica.AAC.9